MESGFLTFILGLSFAVPSSQFGLPDWDDVVVVREGQPTTLVCTDKAPPREAVAINWQVKLVGEKDWKLVLSANERREFSGGASKASMRLTDLNYQDSGIFSLFFLPKMEDCGYYSCLIKHREMKLKERIILLAILTVTIEPAAPIPQQSTLRLKATVNPDFAITKITWAAPGDVPIKTDRTNKGTEAKLPMVQKSDRGAYECMVHALGSSSTPLFAFNVDITVADEMISSRNITYIADISTATLAETPVSLTCPVVSGDYVRLWWRPPDSKRDMIMVYQYDRWRASTRPRQIKKGLVLAGPPYNAEAGSFSFLLTPDINDSGFYQCEVFLDDKAFCIRTSVSILKVTATRSPKKLELECKYKERSHVRSAKWKYQNESHKLQFKSKNPGSISISLPLPITSDIAGNYTCTLQLRNGQTVSALHAVTLPYKKRVSVTTPSLLPSLSALLLLVPLVAAAVGVLLWRQKHISDRGIEQSLSVCSGEVENVYENPEDIRQASPQSSVYMDLKPREEDDVYKELERCEQCQC
ncbi:g6f-like [Cheilinus undulatus]|uniref:g6f-like n=1 Tax=Cheilinus undulatus TaxID=241271 RepID=UPI001BD42F6B|nr:g6f-like [Cheilinus undulatus]